MRKKGGVIGLFDSGLGGITVLKGITKELPNYNYLYLGDTARAPYGNRSQKEIYSFTKQAVSFLFKNNCELIILACNTASSDALRKIQEEYLPQYYPDKKVLGVLIPAAEEALIKTRNKKIGVIGTVATIRSGSFKRELRKLDNQISIFEKACPLLVSLIEAGEQKSSQTKTVLKRYISPLLKKQIDTLILGCTHYSVLEKDIKKMITPDIRIISEERVVPKKLKLYLKKHPEIEKKLGRGKKVIFCTTDKTNTFTTLGKNIFGKNIETHTVSLS